MKKLLGVLLCICTLFGCSKRETKVEINLAEAFTGITENTELPALYEPTGEELTLFGLSEDTLEQYYIAMPMMNVHATTFFFVEAKEGQLETVKEAVDTYFANYEENWRYYLPEQYDLVKNRQVIETGNYICVIISEDAENQANALKEAMGL